MTTKKRKIVVADVLLQEKPKKRGRPPKTKTPLRQIVTTTDENTTAVKRKRQMLSMALTHQQNTANINDENCNYATTEAQAATGTRSSTKRDTEQQQPQQSSSEEKCNMCNRTYMDNNCVNLSTNHKTVLTVGDITRLPSWHIRQILASICSRCLVYIGALTESSNKLRLRCENAMQNLVISQAPPTPDTSSSDLLLYHLSTPSPEGSTSGMPSPAASLAIAPSTSQTELSTDSPISNSRSESPDNALDNSMLQMHHESDVSPLSTESGGVGDGDKNKEGCQDTQALPLGFICKHCGRVYKAKHFYIKHESRCRKEVEDPPITHPPSESSDNTPDNSMLEVHHERVVCPLSTESGGGGINKDDYQNTQTLPLGYVCKYCKRVYKQKYFYTKHERRCRKEVECPAKTTHPLRTFHCDTCPFTVDNQAKFVHHKRTHYARHNCDICGRDCTTLVEFDFHRAECKAQLEVRTEMGNSTAECPKKIYARRRTRLYSRSLALAACEMESSADNEPPHEASQNKETPHEESHNEETPHEETENMETTHEEIQNTETPHEEIQNKESQNMETPLEEIQNMENPHEEIRLNSRSLAAFEMETMSDNETPPEQIQNTETANEETQNRSLAVCEMEISSDNEIPHEEIQNTETPHEEIQQGDTPHDEVQNIELYTDHAESDQNFEEEGHSMNREDAHSTITNYVRRHKDLYRNKKTANDQNFQDEKVRESWNPEDTHSTITNYVQRHKELYANKTDVNRAENDHNFEEEREPRNREDAHSTITNYVQRHKELYTYKTAEHTTHTHKTHHRHNETTNNNADEVQSTITNYVQKHRDLYRKPSMDASAFDHYSLIDLDEDEEEEDEDEVGEDEEIADVSMQNRLSLTNQWVKESSSTQHITPNDIYKPPSDMSWKSTKEYDLYILERLKKEVEQRNITCFESMCNFRAFSLNDIMLHDYLDHFKKPRYFCRKCDHCFTSKLYLDYHLDLQDYGRYVCNKCGCEFAYQRQFDLHRIQHARVMDKFKCHHCNLEFVNKEQRLKHCAIEKHCWGRKNKARIQIHRSMSIKNKAPFKRKRKSKYSVKVLNITRKTTPPNKDLQPRPIYLSRLRTRQIGQVEFDNNGLQPNCVGVTGYYC